MHNRKFTKRKYFIKIGCNIYGWNKVLLFCSALLISSISPSGGLVFYNDVSKFQI